MLAIACFLGIQDPRERPADQRAAADNAHAQFADPKSEFVGILKLWDAYRDAHEELTQSKLRKWAEKHFLGFLRLREWRELHRQLKLLCDELGWSRTSRTDGAGYADLHRALIAGLPTQLGHRARPRLYDGPRGRKFQLFPGSTLAKKPPPWVLSATLLDTERVWALTNAAIEPDWAIAELPHLLARRQHDPRWARSQGRVVGSEQISLFGLVLAPKRPVHYGALFPEEARQIFVRDALVTGEINTRSAFLARNLATLAKAKEEEAKQRRTGLVVDEEWQAQWYLDRLPPHVHNAQALDAWYGKLAPEDKARARMVARRPDGGRRKRRGALPALLGPRRSPAGGALPLRTGRPGRRHDHCRAAAPAQCARCGAPVLARAGLRRGQGRGADQIAAQGAAP